MLVVGCWLLVVGCWLLVVDDDDGDGDGDDDDDDDDDDDVAVFGVVVKHPFKGFKRHVLGARARARAIPYCKT